MEENNNFKLTNPIKKKFIKFLILPTVVAVTIISLLTYNGAKTELEKAVEKNLKILSESIYQSMTNSMLSGVPDHVISAEKDAQNIEHVDYLNISKSKKVIEGFGLKEPYTKDPDIRDVFKSKKMVIKDIKKDKHQMQVLKPFIAEQRCLNCHVGVSKGDVLGVMDLRVSLEDSDNDIAYFTFMSTASNLLLAFGGLAFIMILLNKFVTKPLDKMITIIQDLSSGSGDLSKRININTQDELGQIAYDFNKYLNSIEIQQKKERYFIDIAGKTIKRAEHGYYSELITADIESKSLTQFKDDVNNMLKATKTNIENINKTLIEYSNHDYTKEVKLENIEKDGGLYKLIEHINHLRDVITAMLVESKQTNLTLDDVSDVLLENVEELNQSTIKTEQSLNEVNRDLKDITTNISTNNTNIKKISKLSNSLKDLSENGTELAIQTSHSMDEIDKEVSAINEAITVIEQISFQTNILSLNAAVEAATAGEAGKGFAVVASEVRNLASKSAEAASLIKELVQKAIDKANEGKAVSIVMQGGYGKLDKSISDTTEYISSIEKASEEQLSSIDSINDTIATITNLTKQNSQITKKTKDVAVETDKMAKYAVAEVNKKEFIGK